MIILILFITYSICQRKKLKIINIDNPNFSPNKTSNVVFVFNHMKHGASSPCLGLNENFTDIFGEKWNGYCELTKKGYLQSFQLGKIYQTRFYKLLNISNPNLSQLKSYASQANKTLMTSNALFYGMFINENTSLAEQITVPTLNFKEYLKDELIPIFYYTESSKCKGWKKLVDNNLNKRPKEFNIILSQFLNNYNDVFILLQNNEKMIASKTVIDKVNLFCSNYISNYYDDRYKNIQLFKTLNFTEEKYYNLYYDCLEINLYRYIYIEYGREAEKVPMIVLSEIISEMIFNMDEIIKKPEGTKFLSYIGHDSTLAGFQIILEKVFNISPQLMNFASNQIFLLFKENNYRNNKNKKYKIKYYYNDKLSMIIGYDEFKKELMKLIKPDYDLHFFCEGYRLYDYIILILYLGVIFLISAIVSICYYCRNSLFNIKVYQSLKEEPKEIGVEIKN